MAKKKAKQKEWPEIRKVIALRVLSEGPMDVREFQAELQKLGHRVPGPRKAYNVLLRLLHQDLVRRAVSSDPISYETGPKEARRVVSRDCRRVHWHLTNKGEKRLKYLDRG
jgi:hypothetical protein